jgi:hypothetical protein
VVKCRELAFCVGFSVAQVVGKEKEPLTLPAMAASDTYEPLFQFDVLP